MPTRQAYTAKQDCSFPLFHTASRKSIHGLQHNCLPLFCKLKQNASATHATSFLLFFCCCCCCCHRKLSAEDGRPPTQSVCLRAGSTVSEGGIVMLRSLFDCGSYGGGSQEAQAAYDEAVNAVFNLQVECHRHAQPHISKKDGRTKWAMIEMWPMQVRLHPFCLQFLHRVERPEASSLEAFLNLGVCCQMGFSLNMSAFPRAKNPFYMLSG